MPTRKLSRPDCQSALFAGGKQLPVRVASVVRRKSKVPMAQMAYQRHPDDAKAWAEIEAAITKAYRR